MNNLLLRKVLLILLFGLFMFVKNVLFYQFCFHSLLVSSVFTDPIEFIVFYGAKALPAIFLMAIMFLTKNNWWTIIVSFVFDIWCVTNILYYTFYDLFFTWDVLSLAGNMDGFWESLLPFLDMRVWIFPILTLIYAMLVFVWRHDNIQRRYWIPSISMLFLLLLCDVGINKYRMQNWYSAKSSEEKAWAKLDGHFDASTYLPFGIVKVFGLFTDNLAQLCPHEVDFCCYTGS